VLLALLKVLAWIGFVAPTILMTEGPQMGGREVYSGGRPGVSMAVSDWTISDAMRRRDKMG
jgi:hypothetical protein